MTPTKTAASKDGAGPSAAKTERRSQLLDAGAELVRTSGLMAFTMEGLASAAGVSKALPYRHFANSDAALVALYRRELGRLAGVILASVEGMTEGEEILATALHAYFDQVEERGDLLNALAGHGSPVPDLVEGGRAAPAFIIELLERAFGLRGRTAVVLGSLVGGLATAGSDSFGRGDASRSTVERTTVAATLGAVRAVLAKS